MTFHHTPMGDYHATGDDYRASVYRGNAWAAVVRLHQGGQYYEAYNTTLEDEVMAQLWAEAALLQLRRIAERLSA